MDKVVEDARRMAATSDLNVSDMSAQAPVGTTLAVLERMLKMLTAVQARIHNAMKQEFKLLAAIIRDNTPEDYGYEPEVGEPTAKQADYDMVDVIPVSDPNASTMSQKVVQYQAVFQLSQSAPQIYDLPYLHRQMIETLGVKHADKIVPIEDDMKPVDPITENMNLLNGKPVKAFLYQDHDAHIAAMQDPKMAALIGQDPQAQTIAAATMAHVREHFAFSYRKQIEEQLGAELPPIPDADDEDTKMDAVTEVKVSQLAAMAATRLLQKNQAEAQQQANQQQMEDPLMQAQMMDLKIKQAEVDRKSKKDMLDAAAKADELELKEAELTAKYHLENLKLITESIYKNDEMDARSETEDTNVGMDILNHLTSQNSRSQDMQERQGQQQMQGEQARMQSENDMRKHQDQMVRNDVRSAQKKPPSKAE
jgi:hypothetical protein